MLCNITSQILRDKNEERTEYTKERLARRLMGYNHMTLDFYILGPLYEYTYGISVGDMIRKDARLYQAYSRMKNWYVEYINDLRRRAEGW